MTKYTADDFKHARFATKTYEGGKPCLAVAHQSRDSGCDDRWTLDCTPVGRSDREMADSGFAPVQENPRPLTPDAIEERVERAKGAFYRARRENRLDAIRVAVLAALTEPPARPEGAEEWEDWLIEAMPHESMPDEDIARLADQIAARAARRGEDPSGPLRPLTTDERSYRYAQDLGYELPEDPR